MFLKRIALENVRSIERLEMSFETEGKANRKWSLVLGENGAGKSTILRSIALIVAGSEALSEMLTQPDAWIRLGQKSCAVEADLTTADGQERHIRLQWERGQNIREIFQQNKEAMDDVDAALSHSNRSYFTVGYGASRRLSGNRSRSTFSEIFAHPRAQNVSTLFSTDAVLNPLDTWAMDLEYRRSKEGLNTVRSALADLLPGVSLSRIDRERRELLFETQDGELPLDQLSDGYQNMAAWCGDLLYRITETYKDYTNPLSARGLLLIDEIDLHLHPLWQRVLKQFLDNKLPNFQILGTTHSPLTAQQAGEDELYFLRRPGQSAPAELEHYDGAPNKLMIHQVLLSPAFGLQTMDSKHVEDLKQEYRALNTQDNLPRPKKTRLNQLRDELTDLPEWTTETEQDKEERDLMTAIRDALGNAPNGKGT